MTAQSNALRDRLRLIGVIISILILWNGVCDFIYAYSPTLSGLDYFSPTLSGLDYFSPAAWDLISTAGNRPHWMIMMAQTAGWLYPIYTLSYYHWWIGMRRAGFWLAAVPCVILAYALLMIGGIQHAGFAFLSVLAQAKALVGSTDALFYETANRLIVNHFFMGDLTAELAFYIGSVWHGVGILSGRTLYPRWYIIVSPLGVLVLTMAVGALLPAPFAGFAIGLYGTWFMFIPTVATTLWLWNRSEDLL